MPPDAGIELLHDSQNPGTYSMSIIDTPYLFNMSINFKNIDLAVTVLHFQSGAGQQGFRG